MNAQVRQIITDLGGKDKAAKLCGITEDAVKKWSQNGIPTKHWPIIIQERGIPVDRLMEANAEMRKAS